MARNRYGWQKRAKEIARKQKNDDKMKRRQGKIITLSEEEMPGTSEEGTEEGMDSLRRNRFGRDRTPGWFTPAGLNGKAAARSLFSCLADDAK